MENIVKWKDKELVVRDSHANGGRLSKFWVEDIHTHRVFLVKGSGWFGYEPYSEKMSYLIGKSLGMDILEYDIIPAELFRGIVPVSNKCKHLSICEKIDRHGYSVTTVAEIKRARNVGLKDGEKPITNRQVMYELLPQKYIDTMLLFDAIIGNTDRHYGNVHLLRGTDGDMIGAPILDNGASLLATYYLPQLVFTGYNVGKILNKSYTLEKNHDLQMRHVETIKGLEFNIPAKTMEILNEIEPTLRLIPKTRANAIRKYVAYRLHKYLGTIKRYNKK